MPWLQSNNLLYRLTRVNHLAWCCWWKQYCDAFRIRGSRNLYRKNFALSCRYCTAYFMFL